MGKFFIFLPIFATALFAEFSTTNIQLLHSDSFRGNSFVFDTKNGKKSTLTLEHFREFKYGDVFWFADITNGSHFDGQRTMVYFEISPRISLSKMTGQSIGGGFVKDIYLAGQYNVGKRYEAWLGGVSVDLELPLMQVFGVSVYDKRQSVEGKHQTQTTINYQTESFHGFHMTGFHDITDEDYSTHNQLLFEFGKLGDGKLFIGAEHLHYRHNKGAHTDALQAMLKFSW